MLLRKFWGAHSALIVSFLVQRIGQAALDQWQLTGVAIAHRTGTVLVKEASVIIAASSAHRTPALEVIGSLICFCVWWCVTVSLAATQGCAVDYR